MPKLTSQQQVELRDNIVDGFSLDELNDVCFELGVGPDQISGDALPTKAREVIANFRRRDELNELIQVLKRHRPKLNWPTTNASYEHESDGLIWTPAKVTVAYQSLPSKVILKTNDQFVIVKARGGSAAVGIAIQVLSDIEEWNQRLIPPFSSDDEDSTPSNFVYQRLFLRGIWINDVRGGVVLFIDLLYDKDHPPALSEAEIKQAFFDMETWYEDQVIEVLPKLIPIWTGSDWFFDVADEYYTDRFSGYFFGKPNDSPD